MPVPPPAFDVVPLSSPMGIFMSERYRQLQIAPRLDESDIHMGLMPYDQNAVWSGCMKNAILAGAGGAVLGLVERFDIEPYSDFSAK